MREREKCYKMTIERYIEPDLVSQISLWARLLIFNFIIKVTGIPEGIRKNMTKGKKTVVIIQSKED